MNRFYDADREFRDDTSDHHTKCAGHKGHACTCDDIVAIEKEKNERRVLKRQQKRRIK